VDNAILGSAERVFHVFSVTALSPQPEPWQPAALSGFGGITSQSITFIDAAGSRAQYTVSERDHRNEYYWSTDHGDHGLAPSYAQAQDQARAVLKASMAAYRKTGRAQR
jgi:hypothetical protein